MTKNKISLSAWVIVSSHDSLSRIARWAKLVPLDNLGFYKCCMEYCGGLFWGCRILGTLPDRAKLYLIEKSLAYGAPQHFVLRKQAIAQAVQAAVEKGVQQIVVLGGGFDLLAYRTAKAYPYVACYEIDMPVMNGHKMQLLSDVYGTMPANFHAHGVDLSEVTLPVALSTAPGFDVTRKTLFVAEGLTMYFTENVVRALFADIRKVCASALVVFTAIARHPKSANQFWKKFRNVILSYDKETFFWCMDKEKMPEFLIENGFEQQYQIDYAEFQMRYRTDAEISQLRKQNGEYLVYAYVQDR